MRVGAAEELVRKYHYSGKVARLKVGAYTWFINNLQENRACGRGAGFPLVAAPKESQVNYGSRAQQGFFTKLNALTAPAPRGIASDTAPCNNAPLLDRLTREVKGNACHYLRGGRKRVKLLQ